MYSAMFSYGQKSTKILRKYPGTHFYVDFIVDLCPFCNRSAYQTQRLIYLTDADWTDFHWLLLAPSSGVATRISDNQSNQSKQCRKGLFVADTLWPASLAMKGKFQRTGFCRDVDGFERFFTWIPHTLHILHTVSHTISYWYVDGCTDVREVKD